MICLLNPDIEDLAALLNKKREVKSWKLKAWCSAPTDGNYIFVIFFRGISFEVAVGVHFLSSSSLDIIIVFLY